MLSIAYYMIGLRAAFTAFLANLLVVVAVELAAVAMGLMFACISPSEPIAMAISGPLLTVFSMTGEFEISSLLIIESFFGRSLCKRGHIARLAPMDPIHVLLPLRL